MRSLGAFFFCNAARPGGFYGRERPFLLTRTAALRRGPVSPPSSPATRRRPSQPPHSQALPPPRPTAERYPSTPESAESATPTHSPGSAQSARRLLSASSLPAKTAR